MIDKLEMFIALASERHFGRAAIACGVTQPSLSSAIKQLEDQLGVQLVWRGSRFQGLTPEGQRVLEWARRIVSDTRTMRDEMRAARSGLSGVLRVGVVPTALPVAVGLIDPYVLRHPNVRVTILSRTSVEILEHIEALDLDAGISYLANEPLGRVTTVPLYNEVYRLLVHAGSPVAGRESVSWSEVAHQPLCLLTTDMQNRRIINAQMVEEHGREPAPMIESNSVIALISHVMTGHWASVVPVKMAEIFENDSRLQAIPIRSRRSSHLVGLIAAHREPHTPVLAALLDEARRISEVEA